MVHALTEAHRVLGPDGVAVDFRPDRDPEGRDRKRMPVRIVWTGVRESAGVLLESSVYFSDYLASDHAVRRVVRDLQFSLEYETSLEIRTHFRSLQVLEQYLAGEWTGTAMPAATRRNLTRLVGQYPRAWIVVSDPFVMKILRAL